MAENRMSSGWIWLGILLMPFTLNAYTAREYGGRYSKERIAHLRSNVQKFDWARKQMTDAVDRAKPWLAKSDEQLWRMVPGQDLPRTIDVTYDKFAKGSKFGGCISCGEKIAQFGNYPYNPEFEKKPWKLTCPSCKKVFPTNDFGKFYESGIDEHGLFDPAKGDRSLLFNTDHPDPKDPLHKYGVDDGFGYVHEGRAYKYIGYYTWKYWMYINQGLTVLADAFLYTGDIRYATKAAILLDRIADVYPSMKWKKYADMGWYHSDGGGGLGKIEGSIWETGVVQKMADAYDKILSGTINNPGLYSFLKGQSQRFKLPYPKGTRELFVENVDERLLKTALEAVLSKEIRGNQGMHQMAAAACAVALNTEPYTSEWLDWLFKSDGGKIGDLMIGNFDRDGTSDEGAPGYAFIWGGEVSKLAELLATYPSYTRHNIFRDFPQFKNAYTAAYRMAVLGKAIPNIGDAGATGLVSGRSGNAGFIATGFMYTKDPTLAIAAYRANGYSSKGLGLNIFAKDAEAVNKEIERIGKKAGPRPVRGYQMSGFGITSLETGTEKSGTAVVSNYGRTKMHAHRDILNFDLFAFDAWLAPDHGYPEFATRIPSTTEWTKSTISHNTVLVNKKPQAFVWGGHTRNFVQMKGFGFFELDGKPAYPFLEEYSRTILLIGGQSRTDSDSNAYVVDVFRVSGGQDHVYSFHGPSGAVKSEGLQLVGQDRGTYAGPDVPKGTAAKGFPDGYSFLYNIRRDAAPKGFFMVDWTAEPGYRGSKDNLHLRMHALSSSNDVTLADGDPPQNKPGNPRTLGYVLMHNKGNDLKSTFVSVFEPYRDKPFIRSVERLETEEKGAIVLKIQKIDGQVDYVLINTASGKSVKLPNGISLTGALGYVSEKNKTVTRGVLVNGSALSYGTLDIKSSGPIEGKVVRMDREVNGSGGILVEAHLPIDRRVIGEQIVIETKGERDASYLIHDIKKEGKLTRVFCGPVTFVSNFKEGKGEHKNTGAEFEYDFEEGASFKISSAVLWERNH